MSVWESYMSCIDENNKCCFKQPIPYNSYQEYSNTIPDSDLQKQNKLKKHVCNDYNGKIQQCCMPNQKNSNDILLNPSVKLIKPIYDNNKNLIQYNICQCITDKCKKVSCKDFQNPTRYEACKVNTVDPKNIIKIDSYINAIKKEHLTPDCYDLCK
jgi:hypothetical protein